MATWDDVRRFAMALPEAAEVGAHGHSGLPAWKLKDKTFAWERPLRQRLASAYLQSARRWPQFTDQ